MLLTLYYLSNTRNTRKSFCFRLAKFVNLFMISVARKKRYREAQVYEACQMLRYRGRPWPIV